MATGTLAGPDSAMTVETVPVVVDIRPGLCPNHLRVESALTIPVAVIGTMDFEVSSVDPGTIRLSAEGASRAVEPLGWEFTDVGFPLVGGRCACHELQGDGLDDLELWFSIADLVCGLGLEGHAGDLVPITLRGRLLTGEYIEGVDCALVLGGDWGSKQLGSEIGMLPGVGDEPTTGPFSFAYYTMVTDRVRFEIYDDRGRLVSTLANMDMAAGIYHATWDGAGEGGENMPAGTYFARLSNSSVSEMTKFVVCPDRE